MAADILIAVGAAASVGLLVVAKLRAFKRIKPCCGACKTCGYCTAKSAKDKKEDKDCNTFRNLL